MCLAVSRHKSRWSWHAANGTVLNLAGIKRMDSSCLGEVVASYTSTIASGGILAVTAPTDQVRRFLELTRLDTVINVRETDAEALADFVTT